MNMFTTYFSTMRASIRPVPLLRSDRVWEIDALRGVAIFMMVVYHVLFDLRAYGGYDINVFTGPWRWWQVATASLFTGLVGLSMTLSYNNWRDRGHVGSAFSKYLLRGLTVFSWGLVITLLTLAFDPVRYIRFGILHLIGVSIVLAYPFLRFRWLNLFLGVGIIVLGSVLRTTPIDIGWLDWVGLDATPRPTFDYSPLIPWFGRVLIGIFIGNMFYAGGERQFSPPAWSQNVLVRLLRLMGQNSLLIYLIHQPIIVVILVVIGVVSFF